MRQCGRQRALARRAYIPHRTERTVRNRGSTIQDVAKAAGVSASSVSNYLNGRHDQMGADTRERIAQAIETLGFTPNSVARQLKTGHAPLLGLLVPTVANPFFGELAVAVEQAANRRGFRVVLCNTLRDPLRERSFIEELVAGGVRGLLGASAPADSSTIDWLRRRDVAFAAFDMRTADIEPEHVDIVTMDNQRAIGMAVEHLIEQGHRRIAYVTAAPLTPSRQARLNGYHTAAARAGLAPTVISQTAKPDQSAYGDAALVDLGRDAALAFLALPQRPTATVCMNDMLAMGMAAALREQGLSIPDDLSMVGVDNIAIAAIMSPGLTTVAQPFTDIGEAAVEQIVGRLREPQQPGRETVLAPRLVIRGSTAVLRA
ncbi:MAG: LacI family DNA-binding transcriptional regulator [Rhodocyclaceae bacterium]